jgi:DNA-directed RNA polymerase subunit RPC12/RpoP
VLSFPHPQRKVEYRMYRCESCGHQIVVPV